MWRRGGGSRAVENFSGGDVAAASASAAAQPRVCYLYAYYEKNAEYKENLEYFLKNAGIGDLCRPGSSLYIIINGKCSVDLTAAEEAGAKIIRRENIGYDFGAYQDCIAQEDQTYDYYFFMNSSVRGPYPAAGAAWVKSFIDLFTSPTAKETNVKLAGVSINVLMSKPATLFDGAGAPPYTHVQSQFFVLDREGFDFLKSAGFFADNLDKADMTYMVVNKEIKMSHMILSRGWNINAYLSEYRDKDYRKIKKNINPSAENPWPTCGTPSNAHLYFGRDIKPEDAIFYKTNKSCISL
jgi:hypothetical protein